MVVYTHIKQQFRSSSIDSEKKQLSPEKEDRVIVKKKIEELQKHCCPEDFSLLLTKSYSLLLYHIMKNIYDVNESSWIFKSVVLSPGCGAESAFEFNNNHQTK